MEAFGGLRWGGGYFLVGRVKAPGSSSLIFISLPPLIPIITMSCSLRRAHSAINSRQQPQGATPSGLSGE